MANKLVNVSDEEERNRIIDGIIREIDEYAETKFSILSDFAFDMLTNDCKLKSSECNLDKMGYEIVQCIIQ